MNSGTLAHVGPFAVFVTLMTVERWTGSQWEWGYAMRSLASLGVWWWFSRRLFPLRPQRPWGGMLLGIAVFLAWITPEILSPGYRTHWLFSNPLTGILDPARYQGFDSTGLYLVSRVAGSVLVVPLIEELFWRAWLMRWLTGRALEQVPLGTYVPKAFWLTALLFGLEHGPHWDVGIVAGIAYGWWMLRTRSLADCVLAHATTNACLAAYVPMTGAWSYWP